MGFSIIRYGPVFNGNFFSTLLQRIVDLLIIQMYEFKNGFAVLNLVSISSINFVIPKTIMDFKATLPGKTYQHLGV